MMPCNDTCPLLNPAPKMRGKPCKFTKERTSLHFSSCHELYGAPMVLKKDSCSQVRRVLLPQMAFRLINIASLWANGGESCRMKVYFLKERVNKITRTSWTLILPGFDCRLTAAKDCKDLLGLLSQGKLHFTGILYHLSNKARGL